MPTYHLGGHHTNDLRVRRRTRQLAYLLARDRSRRMPASDKQQLLELLRTCIVARFGVRILPQLYAGAFKSMSAASSFLLGDSLAD